MRGYRLCLVSSMAEHRPESIDSGSPEQSDSRNGEVYTSEEAVQKYTKKIQQEGLFAGEAAVLDKYFVEDGATVLDLGCGAGRTTKPLADRGFDVVGVDQSEPMIEAARELYPDIDFRVDDATDLSMPDATFDYVLFSNNGLDCVYPEFQRRQALREIHRVLRPGGLFAFSSHNRLFFFPALLTNLEVVRGNYLSNGNLQRIGSPYKKDPDEFGLDIYWGVPWRTKAQLDDCDFELVEWVTKRDNPLKYFEKLHRYVAMKPGRR